ncbi:Dcm [Salmonella virus STSR3]|nr:Dcm [Salmonella virus STSR3]
MFKVVIDGVTVTVTVRDDHFIIGALDKLRKVKSLPAEIVEAMQARSPMDTIRFMLDCTVRRRRDSTANMR